VAEAGRAIGRVRPPKWVNEAETAAEEQAVRLSVVKGRPFGVGIPSDGKAAKAQAGQTRSAGSP
jgi:hypothetical protein